MAGALQTFTIEDWFHRIQPQPLSDDERRFVDEALAMTSDEKMAVSLWCLPGARAITVISAEQAIWDNAANVVALYSRYILPTRLSELVWTKRPFGEALL